MKIFRMAEIDGLVFLNSHIDYHDEQNDYHLLAKLGSRSVGIIQYSEWRDEIYINMIAVSPDLRRQKIATQMINELKRLYPSMVIHWGMMTPEGAELKKSLDGK